MRLGGMLTAVLGTALLIVLTLSTTVAASFDWQSRDGTVKWAEGLADRTHVYLDAVEISKIRAQQSPAYIVIAECFSWRDKLVVFTQPSPELRVGQTVDVEGDLITTESGDRALTNVTVWGYTDSAGILLYHGPLIKGLLKPIPWDYKINLTIDSSALRSETPYEPGEVTTDSSTQVEVCPTIADAKAKDIGTIVMIRCHPVSSGGTGSFVLGEDGNTDTLTTNYTGTVSQTARVCVVSGTIDTTDGTDRVLDVDSGPNYNVQESFQGSLLTAHQGSVAWVKSWADGHTFSTGDITGKIITRNWTDYLYIEDDTRACGIRVEKTAHGHVKGEVVSVEGTLATNADGERYIAATTITQTGTGELNPLGMNNKWLGGGDFAYDPGPPVVGQRGIAGAAGLNNIGLLVRTWGRVTELDMASPAQWFLIGDGSNVQTKVAYPPFAYAVDDYVTISGISSCEVDINGDLQRVLSPQPLKCTINQAQGQNDPTNTSPVNFTVIFSEPVSGFTADDVTITGVDGATKTVTGSGTTYNVAVSLPTAGTVVARIPAGVVQNNSGVWNYEAAYTDNSVLFDNVAPELTVTVDHVIPTSRYVNGSWEASDSGSGIAGYYYEWLIADSQYNILYDSGTLQTTYTGAMLQLGYDPTTSQGYHYLLLVLAYDQAGNSSEVMYGDVVCTKARVGYFYYVASPVWEPPTDGFRGWIDSRLATVAASNSSIMQYNQTYDKFWSFPSALDDYDVLVFSCPKADYSLSSTELSQLATWANHWHHRVVFVGDDLYGDSQYTPGAFNSRLNSIKNSVCPVTPNFRTSGYLIQAPYNQGVCYDFGTSRPWLTTGVSSLNYASFGWFSWGTYVARIDYTYTWIVECDTDNGGMCLLIHDCNMFNDSSSNPFVRNFCTKFE